MEFPRTLSPSPLASGVEARLRRLRALAWLLDRSIPLGRWRIGLDPILGLLPGAGDLIGAILSLYLVYEAARLGLPFGVLARMTGNIVIETIGGAAPVVGDIFDAIWQANSKNLRLIEWHYKPGTEPRSFRHVALSFGVFAACLLAALVALLAWVAQGVIRLIGGLF
jgi:hypothetical protein